MRRHKRRRVKDIDDIFVHMGTKFMIRRRTVAAKQRNKGHSAEEWETNERAVYNNLLEDDLSLLQR